MQQMDRGNGGGRGGRGGRGGHGGRGGCKRQRATSGGGRAARTCSICATSKPRTEYSKSQLSKGDKARCAACVQGCRGAGGVSRSRSQAAQLHLQPASAAAGYGARRFLVIGAGLSGAAAAWCLKRAADRRSVTVAIHCFEAARGAGGRLATARIAVGGGAGNDVRANMGAPRLHYHSTHDAPAAEAADLLCCAGVLAPELRNLATDGSTGTSSESISHTFVPTGSSNAVNKWLLQEAGAQLRFGARIRSVCRADGGGWNVAVFGDKMPPLHFDAVVFGGSVAEVFTTHGDLASLVRCALHAHLLIAQSLLAPCCVACFRCSLNS
eukprot:SAG31_NODE_3688_length_3987_cov_2.818930_1_plen_325_part_00